MKELEHQEELLQAARKDLNALTGMEDRKIFVDEIFGFHVQQALEKALKAWITALKLQYPRTHDITVLLAILERHGQDVGQLWNFVKYNAFAVQFRYESHDSLEEQVPRHSVIAAVTELVERVAGVVRET